MQADFAAALLHQDGTEPKNLAHWHNGETAHRFQVYRNNFTVSLIDALQDIFPVCCALTGVDFFRAMARDYVYQYPPSSPVLVQYGEHFADFVGAFEPARSLPYLADVARLERLWLSSYHSADSQPISAEQLTACLNKPQQLQQARVQLAPACRWLSSDYGVLSIWQAHQPNSDIALREVNLTSTETVLLTRPALQVELHKLETDAGIFLSRLGQHQTFSDAVTGLDFDLIALLQILVQQGALVGLITD